MTNYRRYRVKGGCYFFTVVLLNRNSVLLTDNIDLLRFAFKYVKNKHPFDIDALVVLPDHLHCILTLPENDDDFSMRWRLIKATFSRSIAKTETRSQSRVNKAERGIWQRRFWEHAIRDEKDFQQHVDYIHYNPVKHALVNQVVQWPFSTFHKYVNEGIYPSDWSSDDKDLLNEVGE